MLQKFIKPLINGSGSNIASIECSINSEDFTALHLNLEPNYKFAYIDVINEVDLEWIKKKIRECNDLASTINSSVNCLKKNKNFFVKKKSERRGVY